MADDGMVAPMSFVSPQPGSLWSMLWCARNQAGVIALLLGGMMLALLGPVTVPATGQDGVAVHSPVPAPNEVVQAGTHAVGATVTGSGARLTMDGQDLGELSADGSPATIPAVLSPGEHRMAVVAGGTEIRAWTLSAADIATSALTADLLKIGLAASGPSASSRPVVLVNPDQVAHGLAGAPLAVATNALLLPTGSDTISAETLAAIATVREAGQEVMVLGGPDVIGIGVTARLQQQGYTPLRIGNGAPSDVAVQAALVNPLVNVYTRNGSAVRRPVIVAPSQPPTVALQASVAAARLGASLLLADGDTISVATAAVIADSTTVWVADSLPAAAVQAVQQATDETVGPPPSVAQPDTEVWIADAQGEPGLALLAARAAAPGTSVVTDPQTARDQVTAPAVTRVTSVGDAADPLQVLAWRVDGPAAPPVDLVVAQDLSKDVDANEGLQVVLDADRPVFEAFVYVAVAGVEWPGQTMLEGNRVVWTAGPRPALGPGVEPAAVGPAPLTIRAVVNADATLQHVQSDTEVSVTPQASASHDGFVVAAGNGPVVGTGPLRTYTVEVEPVTGLDLAAVTAESEAILSEPRRGWTARSQWSLQRVSDPSAADIRVVVATPGTVDAFCAQAGLVTGGQLSCWDGRRAMLNVDRWTSGVAPFHTDVSVYRQYLVNHEVGHGLGHGHVGCPVVGELAPVMMQQSKGLGSCLPNGWPYPNG